MVTTCSVLALTTAIIAGVVLWVMAVTPAKRKKPLWYIERLEVFGDDELTERDHWAIADKDFNADALSIIFVAVWNNGKETITRDMIAEGVAYRVPTGKIYDAQRIFQTTESNDFHVTMPEDGTSAHIAFDHMGFKQGAVIRVLSDCPEIERAALCGTIAGCEGMHTACVNRRYATIAAWGVFYWMFTGLLPVLYLCMFFDYHDISHAIPVVFTYMLVLRAVVKRILAPKHLLPKEFKQFFPYII